MHLTGCIALLSFAVDVPCCNRRMPMLCAIMEPGACKVQAC